MSPMTEITARVPAAAERHQVESKALHDEDEVHETPTPSCIASLPVCNAENRTAPTTVGAPRPTERHEREREVAVAAEHRREHGAVGTGDLHPAR